MKNRTAKTTTIDPSQEMPAKRSNNSGSALQKMPAKKSSASGDPLQEMPARKSDFNEKYREDQRQMIREGMAEAMQQAMQERYNSMPFKNKAIDLLDRQRYNISREFDGQEVEGTMMERPTAGGGRMEVERFNNMPGGGSFVERTRYNAEGMPVNRTIKDRKINPR